MDVTCKRVILKKLAVRKGLIKAFRILKLPDFLAKLVAGFTQFFVINKNEAPNRRSNPFFCLSDRSPESEESVSSFNQPLQ